MDESINQFRTLLESASQISFEKKTSRNYFEIAGYPNYENVASSILAFFFDTNEEHGLKDLWLKSLIECYKNKTYNKEHTNLLSINCFQTIENGITREEVTPDMKRLDIVVPTNNGFVVAIENKLFADIYNPFSIYSEYMNNQYNQYNSILEVVLSLKPIANGEQLTGTDSKGNKYCFINITYKDLFTAVKNNIGQYILGANEKWLIYMNEFIINIDSLQEENMKLNKEWQSFLDSNNTLINEYNKRIQIDNKSKVDYVKNLATVLQTRFDNEPSSLSTKAYTYGFQSFASHISLVVDICKDNDITIAIEPYFVKAGSKTADFQHLGVFYVAIWIREKECRENEIEALKKTLDAYNIPYTERSSTNWGKTLEIKQYDFSEDVSDIEIENFIFSIWEKIACQSG